MELGYARTSTRDQQAGFDAQLRDLRAAGCERIWSEHVSSVAARPELEAALDFARAGDRLTVCKLDRLARSVPNLLDIVARLERKGVALRILNMSLDTGAATGRMMLTVIGAIAAFEREMMLERQREGIDAAKRDGKYVGRQPTARRQRAEMQRLLAEGVNKSEIARRLGVSRRSVHRILDADAS
jgi:DNA invertase Pin-like site-specific DNA recombinase